MLLPAKVAMQTLSLMESSASLTILDVLFSCSSSK